MDINDPRLAQQIARLVDQRVAYSLNELQPQVRIGVITAVDATAKTVAVQVGANPTASPGFHYASGYMNPQIGNLVRVITRGADRYVDAVLDGTPTPPYAPPPVAGVSRLGLTCSAAATAWTKATGGTQPYNPYDCFWNVSRDAVVNNTAGVFLVVYGGRFSAAGAGTHRVGYGMAVGAPPANPGVRTQIVNVSATPAPLIVSGAGVELLAATTNISLFAQPEGAGGARTFDNGYLHLIRLGGESPTVQELPGIPPPMVEAQE